MHTSRPALAWVLCAAVAASMGCQEEQPSLGAPDGARVEAAGESGELEAAEGELRVLHVCGEKASVRYELVSGDKVRELRFEGPAPSNLRTGSRVRAHGRRQGETLTLAYDPSGSGDPVITPATAPLPTGFGQQNLLAILVNFQDDTRQPVTVDTARTFVFTDVNNFMRENSYQQTWLAGAVAGWFTIPLSRTESDIHKIATLAKQAAVNAGFNLASYGRLAYLFPQSSVHGWEGMASAGGNPSQLWINGSFSAKVVAHELGHNFGLAHSHSLMSTAPASPLGPPWYRDEYGDSFDTMGRGTGHFNAFQKEWIGWLGFGNSPLIQTASAAGTYTIAPYATAGSSPKALKVLRSTSPATGLKTWYYLEHSVAGGVIFRCGSDSNSDSSMLIDLVPETASSSDGMLTVGRTFRDAAAGVEIACTSVTSAGAAVSVSFFAPADVVAPSCRLWGPRDGDASGLRFDLVAIACDDASIARVDFYVDSTMVGSSSAVDYGKVPGFNGSAYPAYAYRWDVRTVTPGPHTLVARAYDLSGNATTSLPVFVTTFADVTAPVCAITAPTGGSTVSGIVPVNIRASDDVGLSLRTIFVDGQSVVGYGGGGTSATLVYSWNTTALADGAHTIQVRATDTANHHSYSNLVTVTVNNTTPDTTLPACRIASPANGAMVTGVLRTGIVASDNFGISKVEFYVDGLLKGSKLDAPYDFVLYHSSQQTQLTLGAHTLVARAYDYAGNVAASSTVSVTVAQDVTPPTCALLSPSDGASLTGKVPVTASGADDIAVNVIHFWVDGQIRRSVANPNFPGPCTATWYWDTTTMTDGIHSLKAESCDLAYNRTSSATLTLSLRNGNAGDTTSPACSITSPANGATVNGSISVAASASDNIGVSRVEFYRNGVLVGTDTSSPYAFAWDTTASPNGSYTLQARAYDAAGNVGTSATMTVTVSNTVADTTGPTLAITSPAAGAIVSGKVLITTAATDVSGVARVEFYANGALLGTDTVASYSWLWNSRSKKGQAVTLMVRAYDTRGNLSSRSITVQVQ